MSIMLPEFPDRYLTAKGREDGMRICVCVSRLKGGRLVLDL